MFGHNIWYIIFGLIQNKGVEIILRANIALLGRSIIHSSVLKDPHYQREIERIYYDEGCNCMSASEQMLREQIMVRRSKRKVISFKSFCEAWRQKNNVRLRVMLEFMYVEDIPSKDVALLYDYIKTEEQLKGFYDYSKEGYRFIASLMHQ